MQAPSLKAQGHNGGAPLPFCKAGQPAVPRRCQKPLTTEGQPPKLPHIYPKLSLLSPALQGGFGAPTLQEKATPQKVPDSSHERRWAAELLLNDSAANGS